MKMLQKGKRMIFLAGLLGIFGLTGCTAETQTGMQATEIREQGSQSDYDQKIPDTEQSESKKASEVLTGSTEVESGTASGEVHVSFAGDICLTEDGFVIDHYDAVGQNLSECITDDIRTLTNAADIFVLNHEYPVSTRGTALAGKYYTFRASPEREQILKELGCDLVSLANNHIYDYGPDAFLDTLQTLKDEGIPYMGAGENLAEAKKPVYFTVNGIKIGFLAANRSEKIIYTPEAGENSPGVVRMYDTQMMDEMIREASDQCDYLIAYVHWGTEDSPYYEEYQREIAKEFFDAGLDALIGGHPHVLQGMEYIDGKPVIYSLGDFWFNSESKYTTIVNLDITKDGLKSVSFVPCRQEDYKTRMLYGEDADAFYAYLQNLSPNAVIDSAGMAYPAESE